jgi:hypothetical protein
MNALRRQTTQPTHFFAQSPLTGARLAPRLDMPRRPLSREALLEVHSPGRAPARVIRQLHN